MKLHLLFIGMEFLILLAYPIVFLHGELRRFSKSKGCDPVKKLFVAGSAASDK